MLAKHELRNYTNGEKVWVGRYKNSHNLLHWHYDCELLYVEAGTINVFCDGKNYTLQQGQSMFIDSGMMHFMHGTEETILLVFLFQNDLTKSVSLYRLESPLLSKDYALPELFQTLQVILDEKQNFYQQMANNLTEHLVLEVYQSEKLVRNRQTDTAVEDFKKLLVDIEDKYASYTFDGAVKFMNVSDSYFSKLFHGLAGMTFSQYLNHVKVEHAIGLLRSDRTSTITEIGIACGFGTIRNFNRVFKSVTGYTPKHLPLSYELNSNYIFSDDQSFNPTLTGTELL